MPAGRPHAHDPRLRPFPLTFVRGEGATLNDADGHEYVDLLGDYTAGLFGRGERRVLGAVDQATSGARERGRRAPARGRARPADVRALRPRPLRFTNSGTEANLMAITAARHFTGRSKLLVFPVGYHGGVLFFSDGVAPWNAPYEFVVAPYNDLAATSALIDEHGADLAAVLVEPMLGSGGCIPAAPTSSAASSRRLGRSARLRRQR